MAKPWSEILTDTESLCWVVTGLFGEGDLSQVPDGMRCFMCGKHCKKRHSGLFSSSNNLIEKTVQHSSF